MLCEEKYKMLSGITTSETNLQKFILINSVYEQKSLTLVETRNYRTQKNYISFLRRKILKAGEENIKIDIQAS